ncbi:MAG TPA: PilN domain-containing protein [Ruminiclostridium sp.]
MKDLNLIPKSYFIEKTNKIRKAYLSILILCIGFIAAVTYIAPTVYEYNLKSEKKSLEQQVLQTNNFVVLENEFNSLKQAIDTREQESKLLSQKKMDVLGMVNAIEFALPDKLFIQKFDTNGENEAATKISLNGFAENEETIASFIRNLTDDGYFNEVVLSSVIKNQNNNGSSFAITLNGIRKSDLTIYEGWNSGFSIEYQANWSISQEKDNKVVFIENKAMSVAKPASLEVSVETTNLQVENFTKQRQNMFEKNLKNFKLVYSSKTKSSKVDAIKTMYYADEDNIQYQYLELCVIKNNKSYVVTYKSDSTSFSNKAGTIDRILKSFSIN